MVEFAPYLRRVLCKTRLIFPRINGPIVTYYNRVRLGVRIVKEINKHLFTLSWLNKINQKELYERAKVASRG